ncbi:hydrolase [Acinetobacter qingfengensis]|uniref:Hydrolase n=1 Tax=Acinetobacter qingfengensis TaxID=1262585 RepID=A0A1E7RC90_9GAMM|nr:hydrolase [Acinetobacter qingfengensis]KAA8734822.1 hydrolase [Acinetobacter qingfengensis]OEY96862.1 hydrolase [Acinetobacter qingfengensis]
MTEQIFIQGAAGAIEIFEDRPEHIKAIAVVTHPHPLMGGNPQHKIPQLIADILVQKGCLVWRPSFRGMGQSAGEHDQGHGESIDIAHISQVLQKCYPDLPFYGGGFSFGSHVWAKAYHLLEATQRPKQLVLAGLPCGFVRGAVNYQTPEIDDDIFLIHGEQDDITPLSDTINWAKPQRHPITIMPGANHFFTGYLKPLRMVIERYYLIESN